MLADIIILALILYALCKTTNAASTFPMLVLRFAELMLCKVAAFASFLAMLVINNTFGRH